MHLPVFSRIKSVFFSLSLFASLVRCFISVSFQCTTPPAPARIPRSCCSGLRGGGMNRISDTGGRHVSFRSDQVHDRISQPTGGNPVSAPGPVALAGVSDGAADVQDDRDCGYEFFHLYRLAQIIKYILL